MEAFKSKKICAAPGRETPWKKQTEYGTGCEPGSRCPKGSCETSRWVMATTVSWAPCKVAESVSGKPSWRCKGRGYKSRCPQRLLSADKAMHQSPSCFQRRPINIILWEGSFQNFIFQKGTSQRWLRPQNSTGSRNFWSGVFTGNIGNASCSFFMKCCQEPSVFTFLFLCGPFYFQ